MGVTSKIRVPLELHDAARVNNVHVLKNATRQQLSRDDQDGCTPGLVAAKLGNLDALRVIVRRGGRINQPDSLGNSILHLAAMNNHKSCVDYLINIGCNLWSLDDDLHTALDVAISAKADDVVPILQDFKQRQENLGIKVVSKFQARAMKDAKRRRKMLDKIQEKRDKQMLKQLKSSGGKSGLLASPSSDVDAVSLSSASTLMQSSSSSNFSEIVMSNKQKSNSRLESHAPPRRFGNAGGKSKFHPPRSAGFLAPGASYANSELSRAFSDMSLNQSYNFVRGRPFSGQDLATTLSRIDLDASGTNASFEDTFIEDSESLRSVQLDDIDPVTGYVQDPFEYCEPVEIKEPTDTERLEFMLECYGLRDLLPIFLNEGYSYGDIVTMSSNQLNNLNVGYQPRCRLMEALESRAIFRATMKSGGMVDMKL